MGTICHSNSVAIRPLCCQGLPPGSNKAHNHLRTRVLTRHSNYCSSRSQLWFAEGQSADLELKVGVEPTTCGLRNRCSTTELLQRYIDSKI